MASFIKPAKSEAMLCSEMLEKAYQQWYRKHTSIVAGRRPVRWAVIVGNGIALVRLQNANFMTLSFSCIAASKLCTPVTASNMENLTHDCLRSQSKVWNETCIYLRIYFLAALEGHYHKFSAFKLISIVTIKSLRSEIMQNFFKEKQIKFLFKIHTY